MALPDAARLNRLYVPLAALILLAGFAIATAGLTRDSLWADEAFTLWAVHDSARPPQGAAATARYVTASLGDALAHARADVHPPLYFILFDAWTLAVGESVFAARLFSVLALLPGAAAVCALGAHLFNRRAGLLAAALLLTAPLTVYYAREARMYTLLLALAALSTLAYVRWRQRASWPRGLAWGLLAAALLYTHYAGALVIAAQALHALLTRSRARVFAPLALAGALFAPWLPSLLSQIQAHGGPAALPVDSVSGAAALWLALTAGAWWLYALALALNLTHLAPHPAVTSAGDLTPQLPSQGFSAVTSPGDLTPQPPSQGFSAVTSPGDLTPQLPSQGFSAVTSPGDLTPQPPLPRRGGGKSLSLGEGFRVRFSDALLLVLWLLLTPAALLALNGQAGPAFQLRYTLAIVPAWALLLARGIVPRPLPATAPRVLRGALALALIAVQLAAYDAIWPPKPRWDEAVRGAAAARAPLEPALSWLDPQSPAAYYDRLYGLSAGLTLNSGWRWQEADAVHAHAERFADAPRVWLLARSSRADAWDALFALLTQGRSVGYRDSVMDTVFYRFDHDSGEPLRWRFGDLLDYTGGIGHRLYARAGTPLCLDVRLAYRAAPPDGARLALTLTQGYDTVRAADTVPLPPAAVGAEVVLPVCISVPEGSPAGPYHLRVQTLVDGGPLPLLEADTLYWGDTLITALVSVS